MRRLDWEIENMIRLSFVYRNKFLQFDFLWESIKSWWKILKRYDCKVIFILKCKEKESLMKIFKWKIIEFVKK